MFQTTVSEKIETHILYSVTFSQKLCRWWGNVEKYGRARQSTDDNIIQHTHFACWMIKTTDTYSEYLILIAFAWQQWLCKHTSLLCLQVHCLSCYANTPHCYVYRYIASVVMRTHLTVMCTGTLPLLLCEHTSLLCLQAHCLSCYANTPHFYVYRYTPSNKNPLVWYFGRPA